MASESLLSCFFSVFRHFCGIYRISDLQSRSEVIQGIKVIDFGTNRKRAARIHISISGQ